MRAFRARGKSPGTDGAVAFAREKGLAGHLIRET
jgi:hypothetical protein